VKIYFDMDGVLSDLYGAISAAWGIPPQEITGHSEATSRRYYTWVLEPPGAEEIFAALPPLHLEEMRALMLELSSRGHELAILSSLGVSSEFSHGPVIKAGKLRWLQTHFGDFIESGVLGDLHFVDSGSHKKEFAGEGRLLVDDTAHLVDAFIEAGGLGVRYKSWKSAESMGEILERAVRVSA
jgi:hypothetical protein